MIILTLNCGSSSAKYQVYDWENKEVLGNGVVERIGEDLSVIENSSLDKEKFTKQHPCPTHKEAIELIINTILDKDKGCVTDINDIKAVGHRVVHGGEAFTQSVMVDDDVIATMERLSVLAPLHNPANITGIKAAQAVLPQVPHCAVLDTAWHQTMPNKAFMYALPYEWYTDHNVRRYGFHGTSYLYTAKRAATLLGKKPLDTNLIVAHIGNGASMCAIKNGICVDTSMGLTPLEGLVMGTRSGDMDPAIIPYIMNRTGMDALDVDLKLNKESGLLGITGEYIDRRDIQKGAEEGKKRCLLAQDMEAYRIKKYLGSYSAVLGQVDAIVFTAGVGEMAPNIRAKVLENLENIGIKVDMKKNALARTKNCETCISTDDSKVKVFIIPTDEELVMTEDTFALMNGTYDVHTNFTYSFQDPSYVNKSRERGLPKDLEKNPGLKDIIAKA
jgi:acetate kinase